MREAAGIPAEISRRRRRRRPQTVGSLMDSHYAHFAADHQVSAARTLSQIFHDIPDIRKRR